MKRLAPLLLCLALTACATAPAPDTAPQTRAQALAALLIETESTNPARLAAAEPEMSALAGARDVAGADTDAKRPDTGAGG
jgi:hypothetical protein